MKVWHLLVIVIMVAIIAIAAKSVFAGAGAAAKETKKLNKLTAYLELDELK